MALPWIAIGAVAIGTAILLGGKNEAIIKEPLVFPDTDEMLLYAENLQNEMKKLNEKRSSGESIRQDEYAAIRKGIENLRARIDSCNKFVEKVVAEHDNDTVLKIRVAIRVTTLKINEIENMLLRMESE